MIRAVVSTESLKDGGAGGSGAHGAAAQLDVNSGGRVFFCFFAPARPGEPEGLAVLKFGPSRLLMQAEQFANELTRHLDICAPDCRIVRQAGASSEEWRAMSEACARLGSSSGAAELAAELASLPVVLLMEYCPGAPLLQCQDAFRSPGPMLNTFEELGRLFLLDAVLGNADRLPCIDLAWRGNPNNVLYGRRGSRYCSHIVAIDSCVQRRPPAARLSAEDAGVDRLAQLLLTDQDVTLELLRHSVLARSPPGLAALDASPAAAAEAFQRGFRECLGRVERIKGLLEMMHSKMHDWSMEFIADIKALRPELPIPTPAVTVAGPSPEPSGASGGGGGGGSRVVAHYTGLNIRVNPAAGGGGGGPGRNRTPLARVSGAGAAGGGSAAGSPARPARPSPYLASSAGRAVGRPRNVPHHSTSCSGAAEGVLTTPSSVARRRASLSNAPAAAAAAMAAADASTPAGATGAVAAGQHLPQGPTAGSPSVTGEAGSGGAGAGSSSIMPHRAAGVARRAPAAQRQRVVDGFAGGGDEAGSSLGADPLQQCLRRRVPGGGNAAGSTPSRLAYSPYMPSARAVGIGGSSVMALRRRRSASSSGASRCASLDSNSNSGSSGCSSGAARKGAPVGAAVSPQQAQMQTPSSRPPAPAAAGDGATPQGHAAEARGCGSAGSSSTSSSPLLPPMRRASSPCGGGGAAAAAAAGGDASAVAPAVPEVLPPARRASEIGVGAPALAGRAAGDRPPCPTPSPPPPPPPPTGVPRPVRPGRSVGSSPSRLNPAALRLRPYGSAATDGTPPGLSPAGMRYNRSFGMLRSPRQPPRQSCSPRKTVSPATPKFRSPLVLDPLDPRPPAPAAARDPGGEAPAAAPARRSSPGGHADEAGAAAAAAAARPHLRALDSPSPFAAAASHSPPHPGWRTHEGSSPLQPHSTPGCAGVIAPAPAPSGTPLPSALQPKAHTGAHVLPGGARGGSSSHAKPPLPRASSNAATRAAAAPASVTPCSHASAGAPRPARSGTEPGSAACGSPPHSAGRAGSPLSTPLALPLLDCTLSPHAAPAQSPRGSCPSPIMGLHVDPAASASSPGAASAAGQRRWRSHTDEGLATPDAGGAAAGPTSPFSFHAAGPRPLSSPRSLSPAVPGLASPAACSAASAATPAPPPAAMGTVAASAATPTSGTPHTPTGSSCQPVATSTCSPPSTAHSNSSAGQAARRAGAPAGAGGRGANGAGRGTPGAGRAIIIRASPNHASPYEQLKSDLSLTLALKSINNEARKDDLLSNRVQHWKEVFRSRGEELKAAVGEWQSRHQLGRVLSTGFLDGTHPIVDAYELKVRLEHMLRRLQVLQEAAAAQKPSCVLQPPAGLFVGGAVCADSHHILRHLGITHVVNATEELLLPPQSTGFVALRVPLRDMDDEDISKHFADVSEFIQSAHSLGGSVLVHCSEGKSRSVTLLLAYLMRVKGWRLKAAYDHIKLCRPVACPNAGFMARLLAFERELFGDNSYIPPVKKAKPEPVMCPVCGAPVGISSASLAVHMKRAHPSQATAAAASPAAAQAAATVAAPAAVVSTPECGSAG